MNVFLWTHRRVRVCSSLHECVSLDSQTGTCVFVSAWLCFSGLTDGFVCVRLYMNVFLWTHRRVRVCSSLHECVSLDSQTGSCVFVSAWMCFSGLTDRYVCVRLYMNVFLWTHRRVRVCSSLHECVSLDSQTGSCVFVSAWLCFSGLTDGYVCVCLCMNVFLWTHRRVRVCSSLHECVSLDSQTGSCVFVSAWMCFSGLTDRYVCVHSAWMCFSGLTDRYVCVRLCMNVFLWTHRQVRVCSSLHECVSLDSQTGSCVFVSAWMCFSGLTDRYVCVHSAWMCFSGLTDGFVCVRLCMNVFLWTHRQVRVCSSLHECVSLDSQTGSCAFTLHECVSLDSQTGSCVFVSTWMCFSGLTDGFVCVCLYMNVFLWTHRRVRVCSSLHECVSLDSQTGSCVFVSAWMCFSGLTDRYVCVRLCMNVFLWTHRRVRVCSSLHECVSLDSQTGSCVFVSTWMCFSGLTDGFVCVCLCMIVFLWTHRRVRVCSSLHDCVSLDSQTGTCVFVSAWMCFSGLTDGFVCVRLYMNVFLWTHRQVRVCSSLHECVSLDSQTGSCVFVSAWMCISGLTDRYVCVRLCMNVFLWTHRRVRVCSSLHECVSLDSQTGSCVFVSAWMCISGLTDRYVCVRLCMIVFLWTQTGSCVSVSAWMCFFGLTDGFVCVRLYMNVFLWTHRRVRVCLSLHDCVSLDSDGFVCVCLCMNVFLWIHRRVRVCPSLHECVSLDSQTGSCVFVSAWMCFSGFTDGFVCVRLCMNVFLWTHRRVRVCSSLHECVSLDSQTGSCVFVSAWMCFSGLTDGFVCVRLCMNVFLWTQTGSCVFVSAWMCFSGLTDGLVCVRLYMNVFLWTHRQVRVCLSLHECVSLDSQTGSCVFVSTWMCFSGLTDGFACVRLCMIVFLWTHRRVRVCSSLHECVSLDSQTGSRVFVSAWLCISGLTDRYVCVCLCMIVFLWTHRRVRVCSSLHECVSLDSQTGSSVFVSAWLCISGLTDRYVCVCLCMIVFLWTHRRVRVCSSLHECVSLDSQTGSSVFVSVWMCISGLTDRYVCVRLYMNVFLWTHRRVRVCSSLHDCVSLDSQTGTCVFVSAWMCFSGLTDGFVCVRLCMNVFLWTHRRVRVCSSLYECVSLDSQTGSCVFVSAWMCISGLTDRYVCVCLCMIVYLWTHRRVRVCLSLHDCVSLDSQTGTCVFVSTWMCFSGLTDGFVCVCLCMIVYLWTHRRVRVCSYLHECVSLDSQTGTCVFVSAVSWRSPGFSL